MNMLLVTFCGFCEKEDHNLLENYSEMVFLIFKSLITEYLVTCINTVKSTPEKS